MAKNSENLTRISLMRSEIDYYVGLLCRYIEPTSISKIYQMPRRSDRMYAYRDLLQDACCACFRSGEGDGKRPVVYGYNGKTWSPLLPMVFENAVGEALVKCAGNGDFIVRSDWVDRQSKIMDYAFAGVSASPLKHDASYVGFEDGVWDFTSVDSPVYHSFKDAMPVTSLLPYSYDPEARCPQWDSFLSQMLGKADIRRLQKFFGLGVVARHLMPSRIEDSLWMIGSGANGKSTMLNVLREVYGHESIGDASLGQLLDRNPDGRMRALYSVEGKLFNICDEVDVRDISYSSDAFKKLCSGEPQNVRGIGKDIHVAYDIPFMVLSMNQMPSNRFMDAAFRRRIVRIDFRCSVRQEDMDLGLQRRLLDELPGIRNWMIEGYKMLRKDNYKFDHTADEAYMEVNEQYFDIFCKQEHLRPSAWAGTGERPFVVRAADLLDHYTEFCLRNLYPQPTHRGMSQDCRRLGYRSERRSQGVFYEMYADEMPEYGIRI